MPQKSPMWRIAQRPAAAGRRAIRHIGNFSRAELGAQHVPGCPPMISSCPPWSLRLEPAMSTSFQPINSASSAHTAFNFPVFESI